MTKIHIRCCVVTRLYIALRSNISLARDFRDVPGQQRWLFEILPSNYEGTYLRCQHNSSDFEDVGKVHC